MIIDRNLSSYTILAEESLRRAVQKIEAERGRIIFAVSETGHLEGLLTNGDILRWLARQESVQLDLAVRCVVNTQFVSAHVDDKPERLHELLERVLYVPIVDEQGRLVSVARHRQPDEHLRIGNFTVGDDAPVFVIAEIGINHNGSLALAKRLIDASKMAGANCAKFQMRDLGALYSNAGEANDPKENLGSQYTLDLLTRFQLSVDEMLEAFDYCNQQGILPLCTPWDHESLQVLEDYGTVAYKVASADLTNHELLRALAATGKPLICSTGMSMENEIRESAALLKHYGAQYVLLHCNSTYPAPFKDINLNYLARLAEVGDCPVGYSGHERGINVAISAVAKGARVIEKHITLDRSMEGNDHKVSLHPNEFAQMIEGIRQVEEALGTSTQRAMSQGEMMNRVTLAKSLVINQDLAKGEEIRVEMIETKSPGRGLQPNRRMNLIGRQAKRNFAVGDFFYPSDLVDDVIQPRDYRFRRAWGVPVRYHDFQSILEKSNPDFLEFHLSYKDMDETLDQHFSGKYDLDFTVHSPDVFAGDHLLNLCDPDPSHRERSIRELQRVVDITRELQPFFIRSARPLIIASVGGFTRDGLVHPSERSAMYELLAESMAQLDTEGVEIIPQTLPPFPWYFGGQLFLNLFVDARDTAKFCEQHGYRICFDTCHSKLACNHFKWSFKEFTECVGPHTAHLHVSDAAGVDGEGLQVGEGDMDFPAMADDLNRLTPDSSFIPEIWQGHENGGEGFWIALERLEGLF